jgi:hypothetical protein
MASDLKQLRGIRLKKTDRYAAGGSAALLFALAAVILHGTGHGISFGISVVLAFVSCWVVMMIRHFSREPADARWSQVRTHMLYEGRPRDDIDGIWTNMGREGGMTSLHVPVWLRRLSLMLLLAGVGVLAWGILVRIL